MEGEEGGAWGREGLARGGGLTGKGRNLPLSGGRVEERRREQERQRQGATLATSLPSMWARQGASRLPEPASR